MMSHHLEWKGGSFLSFLHWDVCGFPCFFSDLPLMKQASLVSFCLDYAVPIDMHGLYQVHATYCHHFPDVVRLTCRDRRPTLHHRPSWESLVQTPWKTLEHMLTMVETCWTMKPGNLILFNDFLYILTSRGVLESNVFGNQHDQNTIGNTCWPKCIENCTKVLRFGITPWYTLIFSKW